MGKVFGFDFRGKNNIKDPKIIRKINRSTKEAC